MIQYPSLVQIETSAFCNASCKFCPHSSRELGPAVRMSQETFERIINEITEWPRTDICPFLTNEPFADARIYEWCQFINHKLPRTRLFFYTNGSLFTADNVAKLSQVANIEDINISLHHSNKADYEAELEIPFDKTVESIHRLLAAHRLKPIAKRIVFLRVGTQDRGKDGAFNQFCERQFPGIPHFIAQRWNWKGDIASSWDYEKTLDIICPRQNSLCILASGKVALCCLDQNAQYSLGDINQKTLLEVYNGALALKYRSATKRHLTPCQKCNMH